MLTLNKNIDQKVIIDIVNQDAKSDTKFYYDKLLTDFGISVINKPFDTELYEYKPVSETINYFIYFLSFKDKNFNQDVINNIEPGFADYYNTAKTTLQTIHKGNGFDFLQNNGNINITPQRDTFKVATEAVLDKPYQITDYVMEVNRVTPIKPGLPLFYDTFTFPFADKLTTWNDRVNKFSDLPALYNSFLILDFYTSPNRLIQQKMLSLPIYVVDRYMMYEKSVNNVRQLRPTFLLKNGIEGYSVFFLQNFGINKLYIKYSFWDAMNGSRIPLIASSIQTGYKKGIQSVSKFDHRNEYIMIDLNFNNHTYRMYEFNNVTKSYDIQAYDFDLYELFYDDFWAGKLVKNTRPVALPEPTTYLVNPNDNLNTIVSNTRLDEISTITTNNISNTDIQNYFNNFNGVTNEYILEYMRNRFSEISTKKTQLTVTENTLITDDQGNNIKTKSYKKTFSPIVITNNGESRIKLYDLFLSNFSLTQTPLYTGNNFGTIDEKNKIVTGVINSKKKKNGNQKILVENYKTYSDLGLYNQKHKIVNEFQYVFSDKFNSPHNQQNANKHNIIENLDFDTNNPNSLVTYIKNNYIYAISSLFGSVIKGLLKVYGKKITDNTVGYYNIISIFEKFDDNINKLKFKNLSIPDRVKFLDATLNYTADDVIKKLSNEIPFQDTPLNNFRFTDLSDMVGFLKDNDTVAKNIDMSFTRNGQTIYLRDLMVGFNASCNNANIFVNQNEKIEIDINFMMGEQFLQCAYDSTKELYVSCVLKVLLTDELSNRKIYDIPLTYKLQ